MDQQTGTETVASKPLVPLLLSSILPSLSRSLLDDPRPKPVFLDYWKQAFERLSTVDDSDLPDLETDLPEDLNQCLDAVLEIVGPTIEATSGTQDAREDSKRSRLAACTVLLGWLPQQSAENESQLSGAWECPFCLASFDIPGSCRNENEPTSKRQRTTRSPYSCHRHYCPFVCGFCIQGASSGEPLWKGLCERIQAAPEVAAERADDAYRELHRLLRSSVSPRFRKALSSSVGAGKS